MTICKGCGKDEKLIKAHIIPESFFCGLRDGQKPPKMHFSDKGSYPKKVPIGIYDKEILCFDCEQIFKSIDDYGNQVLLKKESDLEPLVQSGNIVGYLKKDLDYSKLKLFFMSILWRASVSNHDFYSNVKLGKLEKTLKGLVWDNHSGSLHDFSFVLAKFVDNGGDRAILSPHKERFFGISYYRFYLYGYILYIKADSQKTPERWTKFISQKNNTLAIVSRGLIENSKEYPVILKAVQKN
tara:strand:+ start:13222 stop:13941 length:720 start_codon:yes stop_codon:yes gene_type:complete